MWLVTRDTVAMASDCSADMIQSGLHGSLTSRCCLQRFAELLRTSGAAPRWCKSAGAAAHKLGDESLDVWAKENTAAQLYNKLPTSWYHGLLSADTFVPTKHKKCVFQFSENWAFLCPIKPALREGKLLWSHLIRTNDRCCKQAERFSSDLQRWFDSADNYCGLRFCCRTGSACLVSPV